MFQALALRRSIYVECSKNPIPKQLLNLIYTVSHLNGVFHNCAFWIMDCYVTTSYKYQWYCLFLCRTYWVQTQFLWACCSHHYNMFMSLVSPILCLPLPHLLKHLLGMVSWASCFLLYHLILSFHHLGMLVILFFHFIVNYINLH